MFGINKDRLRDGATVVVAMGVFKYIVEPIAVKTGNLIIGFFTKKEEPKSEAVIEEKTKKRAAGGTK